MALEDILTEAVDGVEPLSRLLTRALVSAQQEGHGDLAEWLEHETRGYEWRGRDSVPSYRVVGSTLEANNPLRGWQPIAFEDLETKEIFETVPLIQSLTEIEAWCLPDTDSVYASLPPDAERRLQDAIGYRLPIARRIPAATLPALLNQVRHEFIQRCMAVGVAANLEPYVVPRDAEGASQVLNVNVGDGSSAIVGSEFVGEQVHVNQRSSAYNGTELDQITQFISELRGLVGELGLEDEQQQEIIEQCDAIAVQLDSDTPDSGRIRRALGVVRNVTAQAAGSIVAQGIIATVQLFV